MILPIQSYGRRILRKTGSVIDPDYPDLDRLIDAMWETMYSSNGVGLAAPQINQAIRLFIIDSHPMYDTAKEQTAQAGQGFKGVCINARIIRRSTESLSAIEGCLSLPGIWGEVARPWQIEIEYFDRRFRKHRKSFRGATARVIQHEYDHTEGRLFIDHIPDSRLNKLKRKLQAISKAKVKVKYPMRFPKSRARR